MQKVTIPNSRDLTLAVDVYKLPAFDPMPTILMLPGFKGYKEEETFTTLAAKLLRMGVATVVFDPSGFGESGGTTNEDYRFSHYVRDAEDVYDWMKQQSWIDSGRTFVLGHSMGGLLAVIFASKHKELKAGVFISPVNKMGTTGELVNAMEDWKKTGNITLPSSRYGQVTFPWAFMEDVQEWEAEDFAPEIKIPQLYVLGLSDKTVVPDDTRKIFQLAQEPKKLVEIPDMDHFYKRDQNKLEEVNEVVADFIQQHL